MKSPGEHARLARAFGLAPTKPGVMIAGTGSAAFIGLFTPFGLILAGGLLAGAGSLALDDRRLVRNGLREVELWGFPVIGYRAWMLADEPTFELEVAREMDLDVLVTSARAIDSSIQVTRTGERAFRIVTRRVALPSRKKDGPVYYVGDRQLLKQLHARLLAPLHADVGIRRIQMGDRATLKVMPLLPASTEGGQEGGMGAFRTQAMAAPPALQALAEHADRELPHEARKLKHRAERVVYAVGSAPHGAGTVLGFAAGGAVSGAGWLELAGLGLGAIAGLVAGTVAAINGNRRNAQKVARSVHGHGFTIEGYDDWLISGRPIFDIELAQPIDPAYLTSLIETLPRAFSISANREVSWVEELKWLDNKMVRIETRPALIEPPSSRIEPFYGGSHQMFQTFVHQVLAPLHTHAGIASLRMGGYIDRRV